MRELMRKICLTFTDMSVECRHGVYVWWLTAANLSGIVLITLVQHGDVAVHAVDALSNVTIILVTTYLGVEAVSRSSILSKLAERLGPKIDPPNPPNQ